MTQRLPKRRKISQAILTALAGGTVPRTGVDYIAVGRETEMAALAHDLDIIADGGASFRLIVGRHGAGKSFMMQMLRNYAMQKRFVVANADFSRERRLSGSKGAGLNLYRELLSNMAIRTRPNGNAFAHGSWRNGSAISSPKSRAPALSRLPRNLNEKLLAKFIALSARWKGWSSGLILAKFLMSIGADIGTARSL